MPDFSALIASAARVADRCFQNAAAIDAEGAFPVAEFGWLEENGLLAAPIPPEFGGAGLGTTPASTPALLQVLWHIGRGNGSVGRLFEGHVNALQLVHWFGTTEQKTRWFDDARAGKIFAVWNTQAGDGIEFVAAENALEVRGAKTFCSGVSRVLRPIVTGELVGEGWQMAVVPMETIAASVDESWWQPLGMRASGSFKTDFSGARIGREELLGATGDYYRQPAFSGGAIRFCAVQLGGAAALFDATRRFLRETGRQNDPFQHMRVGQMAAKIESGWQWIERAGRVWDSHPDAAQMVAFAAMLRVATEEICNFTLEMTAKSVGARGLLRPQPFERMLRDLTLYTKQPHLDEIPVRAGKWALETDTRCDEFFPS